MYKPDGFGVTIMKPTGTVLMGKYVKGEDKGGFLKIDEKGNIIYTTVKKEVEKIEIELAS